MSSRFDIAQGKIPVASKEPLPTPLPTSGRSLECRDKPKPEPGKVLIEGPTKSDWFLYGVIALAAVTFSWIISLSTGAIK